MNELNELNLNPPVVTVPVAVSVTTAAELLGISERGMKDLVHQAGFPSFKLGGRVLVSYEGLREWVAARITETAI